MNDVMKMSALPTDVNCKPLPIEIGEDAYCSLYKCVVVILDKVEDKPRFSTGTGYLIATPKKIQWVDASWFWRLDVIAEINQRSKE